MLGEGGRSPLETGVEDHGLASQMEDGDTRAKVVEMSLLRNQSRDVNEGRPSSSKDPNTTGRRLSSVPSRSSTPPTTPASVESLREKRSRSDEGDSPYRVKHEWAPTSCPYTHEDSGISVQRKMKASRRRLRSRARSGRSWTNGKLTLIFTICASFGLLVFRAGCSGYWPYRRQKGCCQPALGAIGSGGPEQIHLAYSGADAGGYPTGMTVMWTTSNEEARPVVESGFYPDRLDMSVEGTSVRYLETVHHRAIIEHLVPGTRVFYRCGNVPAHSAQSPPSPTAKAAALDAATTATKRYNPEAGTWSEVASFLAAPAPGRDRSISVAVFGDMGLVRAGDTLDRLHQLARDEEVDFVLHVGDIAYADDAFLERPWAFGYEAKWDTYMRRASHAFGKVLPYMVAPGNHEAECHSPACQLSAKKLKALNRFQAYTARFRMPSLESGAEHDKPMWYSFNIGLVHWVVINTETDFPGANGDHYTWLREDNGGFGDQLAWLDKDLAKAGQERDIRPWIIVSGHRPMYTVDDVGPDGEPQGEAERIRAAFEPLLAEYKVDVYISGHVHMYERSFPVLDGIVRSSRGRWNSTEGGSFDQGVPPSVSTNMTYEDPSAPVHIISGTGGNIEGFTQPSPDYPDGYPKWHALSLEMVAGVTILTFPSMTEMRSTFVSSDTPRQVLDTLTIRQHR